MWINLFSCYFLLTFISTHKAKAGIINACRDDIDFMYFILPKDENNINRIIKSYFI